MAQLWHNYGMTRSRVSTTVDGELLSEARRLRPDSNDATLLDEALGALLRRHRAVELDDSYRAYDDHPIGQSDEWGDLASFHRAAESS